MGTVLDDLVQAKREMRGEAPAEPGAPAKEEAPEETPQEASPAETEPAKEETPPAAAKARTEDEEEDVIRIGDQEFKTQAEALEYARKLEQEKLISEAYNMGIKETLQTVRPQEEAPAPEENFEEKFYADPKGTLQKIKEEAREEAISTIKKEQRADQLWNTFLTQYPDIEQKDAQRILQENWETIGRMTDVDKAMKVLAQKTRAEYQRIAERLKPRTELPPNKNPQAVSAGRGGVTPSAPVPPAKKTLTFAEELRLNRKQR